MAVIALGFPTDVTAACEQTIHASVQIEFNDKGSVMVPVRVNGRSSWMVLALDEGIPTVFQGTAEQLGLKIVHEEKISAESRGQPINQKVVIDSLAIGAVNFARWDLYILPGTQASQEQFKGLPVLGNLSSLIMKMLDVELNLGQRQINLLSHVKCGSSAVYWGGEVAAANIYDDGTGLMLFPMEIDGKRVATALGTRSNTSLISELVTSRFFGFDSESEGITRTPSTGDHEIASYRAMGLTAKGIDIKNVPVRLIKSFNSPCKAGKSSLDSRNIAFLNCVSIAPMSIGTDLLRKLRVYIASKEGRIYFTRTEEPSLSPPPGLIAHQPSLPQTSAHPRRTSEMPAEKVGHRRQQLAPGNIILKILICACDIDSLVRLARTRQPRTHHLRLIHLDHVIALTVGHQQRHTHLAACCPGESARCLRTSDSSAELAISQWRKKRLSSRSSTRSLMPATLTAQRNSLSELRIAASNAM